MIKKGFGAIDMLVALLIIACVFAFAMPAFKGAGGGNLKDSSIDYQSVEEQVDSKINEIEKMRQQTLNYNQMNRSQEF